jgi:hypothetical protein
MGLRRREFDDQPDFLEEQPTGLVTVVADLLSHDTVVGCARSGGIILSIEPLSDGTDTRIG